MRGEVQRVDFSFGQLVATGHIPLRTRLWNLLLQRRHAPRGAGSFGQHGRDPVGVIAVIIVLAVLDDQLQ